MYGIGCAVWEITLACNMNCTHCGSSAGKARKNELNKAECYKLCEELADVNCDMVSLMGGEPFVRDNWYDIAWCIRDLGMKLAFVSNGLLIPKHINKIVQLEPTVIGISLDGVESTHDSIRKEGSFDAAVNAINLLNEYSIQTTVITTISKTNFQELPKIKHLLSDKEVNWQIQVAEPFGNFNSNCL